MKRIILSALILSISIATQAADNSSEMLQALCKTAYMGQRASEELANLSTNLQQSAEIRATADSALRETNRSATNSYNEITTFIRNWAITNEPPPGAAAIALMKRSVELGLSATEQLATFAADTNHPPAFRASALQYLKVLKTR